VTIHQLDPNKSNTEHKQIVKETGKNPTPPPYLIDMKLGAGVFSEVFSAVTKEGSPFALKRISKTNPKFNWKMVLREINAGKKLNHKGIVRFKDHFETSSNVYLVIEYFEGKDLYSLMEQMDFRPFDERIAKHLFRQIVKALEYCHSKGICHRDIKLENVLVDETGRLKLIDFGLCGGTANKCDDFVGTADYAAPEVLLRRPYDGRAADVWSAGVMLYALLCGEFPFDVDELLRCLTHNCLPDLSWGVDNPYYQPLSPHARSLLESIFVVDPTARPTLKDLRKHEWLKGDKKVDDSLCKTFLHLTVSNRV